MEQGLGHLHLENRHPPVFLKGPGSVAPGGPPPVALLLEPRASTCGSVATVLTVTVAGPSPGATTSTVP